MIVERIDARNGKVTYINQPDEPIIETEIFVPEPTQEERIAELEKQNTILLDCLLEMSEIIYA